MTIWKQRFFRWNYFFVSGLYWDLYYIICNWKLGWWEMGAKLFVFQEIYETLLYLLAPFVLPISFYVRPQFSGYLFAATLALYQINVVIFNYVSGWLYQSDKLCCFMLWYSTKMIKGTPPLPQGICFSLMFSLLSILQGHPNLCQYCLLLS